VCSNTTTVVQCGPDLVSTSPVASCTNQTCIQNGTTASCQGACTAGSTQCSGDAVQTCGAIGQWGSAVACLSGPTCSDGACVPGTLCCNGLFPPTVGGTPVAESLHGGYYWYGPDGSAEALGYTCGTATEGTCDENTSGCTGTVGWCYDAGG
jgi:hypothetical protein